MLEIIYRIYEVTDKETAKINAQKDIEFCLYSFLSKSQNTELVMDCIICDNREQFKDIIRSQYGENIAFRYSKKLKIGDLYCIIIGKHCYDTEKYFNQITFTCDYCGAKVETYLKKPICFDNYEIKTKFFNIQKYLEKRFCSYKCKNDYENREKAMLKLDDEQEFYINRDMFTENVSGYIYKITKKSTGEFYVGQTIYAPVFRWGQHLKTERFDIKNIIDYKFETIEIVPKNCNILEREKYWIQKLYKENPNKSLNIACTHNII